MVYAHGGFAVQGEMMHMVLHNGRMGHKVNGAYGYLLLHCGLTSLVLYMKVSPPSTINKAEAADILPIKACPMLTS